MVKEEVVSKGRGRGGMQQNKPQGKGRGGGLGRGGAGGRGHFYFSFLILLFYKSEISYCVNIIFEVDISHNISCVLLGVFGGRGRGIPSTGRGQQQDKKPGKPQGVKNQH